jgi:hypothetical protein
VLLLHLSAGHDAAAVADAMTAAMGSLPAQLRRSLAWDQGMEMAAHAQIALDTGLDIYFCDPHSPWQRGSNENTNGLLRQYFPKSTDLAVHDREHLDAAAAQLNSRPRKTLGWKTPAQALDEFLAAARHDQMVAAAGRRALPDGRRAAYRAAPPAPRLLRIACGDGLRPALTPETSTALGDRNPRARPAACPRPARGTRLPTPPGKVTTEDAIYQHCCDDPMNSGGRSIRAGLGHCPADLLAPRSRLPLLVPRTPRAAPSSICRTERQTCVPESKPARVELPTTPRQATGADGNALNRDNQPRFRGNACHLTLAGQQPGTPVASGGPAKNRGCPRQDGQQRYGEAPVAVTGSLRGPCPPRPPVNGTITKAASSSVAEGIQNKS